MFHDEKDDIKVYRYHDGSASELSSGEGSDGTYKIDKDAGKITILTFVTHQSKELTKEFEDYCSDRDLCQNEESAEQFVDMRQQMFNEAFENGNV